MPTFGENLRAMRTRAGLTQEDLAARLEFKRTTPLSLWERGDDVPFPKTIVKLATAIGCTPADLLRDVETAYDRLRGGARAARRAPTLSEDDRRWLEAGQRLAALDAGMWRHFLRIVVQTARSLQDAAIEATSTSRGSQTRTRPAPPSVVSAGERRGSSRN